MINKKTSQTRKNTQIKIKVKTEECFHYTMLKYSYSQM